MSNMPSPLRPTATASHSACSTLRTQVTNDNLQEALPAVQAALQACQFFAFDLEMTGLFVRDGPQPYLDEIEDRYRQVRVIAQRGSSGAVPLHSTAQRRQVVHAAVPTSDLSSSWTASEHGCSGSQIGIACRGISAARATAQMREGAQNFQITQFGMSAFVWEPRAAGEGDVEECSSGQYLAHTFNFWIFPRSADDRYSRRFLCQVRRKASGNHVTQRCHSDSEAKHSQVG